jgi:hypothetical protein
MSFPRELQPGLKVYLCSVLLSMLVLQPMMITSQGPNLLQNPGFELPHVNSIPGKENCFLAAPWTAWFVEGSREETSQGYRFAPEYKGATRADVPGNRVRSGDLSQQWFHSYGNFQAGVLQQVPNIPVGARIKFELWVLTWSCDNESKGNCGGATSGDPSPMHVRIGIDPMGGGDVFSPAIAWSPEQNAYDAWHHFEVEAVAANSTVTAFVYSYPDYRSQDNNVYIDDASLVVVALPPTPTRRPTQVPTPTPSPTDTPLPTATFEPTVTPEPTVPPTNTPVPTNTSTPVPEPTHTKAPTLVPTAVPSPTTAKSTALSRLVSDSRFSRFFGLAAIAVVFLLGLLVRNVRPGRGK